MATTPNMSLSLPTVSVTAGPGWASLLNAGLNTIDLHDHSPGYGALIRSASLSIDADVAFNGYNLTLLRTARFQNLSSPPALGFDVGCLGVSGGDLYYVNTSGQQVQITLGAALNASGVGGIGGDYVGSGASAFYASGSSTFSFWSATNKSANLDCASVTVRPPGVTSPNGITIQSPMTLAAGYSLTLPSAVPSAPLPLVMDASGALSTALLTGAQLSLALPASTLPLVVSSAGGLSAAQLTGSQIANRAVTSTQLADQTITAAQIANNTVTAAKVASDVATVAGVNAKFWKQASLTISGTSTQGSIAGLGQSDTNYVVVGTPSASTGTPASGAYTIQNVAKSTVSVAVTLVAAPGTGNSVTWDFLFFRH